MGSPTQSAINVMVQSPETINIIKDIIIPFLSMLLGAFIGGMVSYKLSLRLLKKSNESDLLKQAFTVIHRVSEATFFLAIDFDKKEYLDRYTESITVFREFFTLKTNQILLNEFPSDLMCKMSKIDVQKLNPGKDFVKQCFEITHELENMRKAISDKISLHGKKW